MNAFHVLGGVLALWALLVTALGLMRHDFPGSRLGERLVALISVVLVAGAIGSGLITSANESEEHAAEAAEAAGEHGAQEPAAEEPAVEEPVAEEPSGGEPAGEEPAGGDTPAAGLSLAADPGGQLAYDTDSLEAAPGEVTIVMDNPSAVPHNVALEGDGVDEEGEVVGEGETSQVTAELDEGEYTFFCSVPGHRQAGMEGTLTVAG